MDGKGRSLARCICRFLWKMSVVEKIDEIELCIVNSLSCCLNRILHSLESEDFTVLKEELNMFYTELFSIERQIRAVVVEELPNAGILHFNRKLLDDYLEQAERKLEK